MLTRTFLSLGAGAVIIRAMNGILAHRAESRGGRWGARDWGRLFLILALTWSLRHLVAPHPLVVMGAQQAVLTDNPLVGVHTRLTDEVEAWKIQRTLQMVREMGAPWIVEFFPWPYIEPSPGQYAWDHSDLVISHAVNQGLTVIARLGWVPDWARPDPAESDTTLTFLEPNAYEDFARFVATFAQRYRGKVEHIIVWNEPNLSFEWGYRPVDPAAYSALLQSVYPMAKAANPDLVVLAGALAPTLEQPGSPAGLNDLTYLEEIYEAGGAPFFDGLAAHAYGLQWPPEAEPGPEVLNFRRVELLREIMVAHGDAQKPIFVTEAGWNDHPRWTASVSPAQRIHYTIGAYEWARQHWPWCPAVAMWTFRLPAARHNYRDNYTFVTPTFEAKPIYLEVQAYTRGK
jgi:hypothetical protein